jgi:hypothetical protein
LEIRRSKQSGQHTTPRAQSRSQKPLHQEEHGIGSIGSSKKDKTVNVKIKNYFARDRQKTKIEQIVKNSTVYGSVVAADYIKDSLNIIQKADIQDNFKEQLKQLAQAWMQW